MEKFGIVKGMHIGLAISIVLAIGAIYLQWHYYKSPPKPKEKQEANLRDVWRVMPTALRKLLLTDCIVRFGSNLATVYVVLLVLNVYHLSPLQFGALTSLQMTVAILGYLPAAHFADRYGRQPFILATFAFFALFPLSLAILPPNLIFISFIIGGLREIGEPARKARIVDLSASDYRGRVVGLYYLIRGMATIPAPFIGGLLWQQGYTWPFILAFIIMAFGLLLYAINPKMTPEIS
jgi:MFS family permease